jgi:hypothetical protein
MIVSGNVARALCMICISLCKNCAEKKLLFQMLSKWSSSNAAMQHSQSSLREKGPLGAENRADVLLGIFHRFPLFSFLRTFLQWTGKKNISLILILTVFLFPLNGSMIPPSLENRSLSAAREDAVLSLQHPTKHVHSAFALPCQQDKRLISVPD